MLDLTGHVSGWLVALEPTDERKNSQIVWRCHCTLCGGEAMVRASSLIHGRTIKSCGCLRAIKASNNNTGAEAIRAKTHCPNGHEYAEWNVYLGKKGERFCITCRRLYNAARRAQIRGCLSNLTDEEKQKISDIYEESQKLGPDWHVDHIVPLSKNGPHYPDNLQIIPAVDNLSKGNR